MLQCRRFLFCTLPALCIGHTLHSSPADDADRSLHVMRRESKELQTSSQDASAIPGLVEVDPIEEAQDALHQATQAARSAAATAQDAARQAVVAAASPTTTTAAPAPQVSDAFSPESEDKPYRSSVVVNLPAKTAPPTTTTQTRTAAPGTTVNIAQMVAAAKAAAEQARDAAAAAARKAAAANASIPRGTAHGEDAHAAASSSAGHVAAKYAADGKPKSTGQAEHTSTFPPSTSHTIDLETLEAAKRAAAAKALAAGKAPLTWATEAVSTTMHTMRTFRIIPTTRRTATAPSTTTPTSTSTTTTTYRSNTIPLKIPAQMSPVSAPIQSSTARPFTAEDIEAEAWRHAQAHPHAAPATASTTPAGPTMSVEDTVAAAGRAAEKAALASGATKEVAAEAAALAAAKTMKELIDKGRFPKPTTATTTTPSTTSSTRSTTTAPIRSTSFAGPTLSPEDTAAAVGAAAQDHALSAGFSYHDATEMGAEAAAKAMERMIAQGRHPSPVQAAKAADADGLGPGLHHTTTPVPPGFDVASAALGPAVGKLPKKMQIRVGAVDVVHNPDLEKAAVLPRPPTPRLPPFVPGAVVPTVPTLPPFVPAAVAPTDPPVQLPEPETVAIFPRPHVPTEAPSADTLPFSKLENHTFPASVPKLPREVAEQLNLSGWTGHIEVITSADGKTEIKIDKTAEKETSTSTTIQQETEQTEEEEVAATEEHDVTDEKMVPIQPHAPLTDEELEGLPKPVDLAGDSPEEALVKQVIHEVTPKDLPSVVQHVVAEVLNRSTHDTLPRAAAEAVVRLVVEMPLKELPEAIVEAIGEILERADPQVPDAGDKALDVLQNILRSYRPPPIHSVSQVVDDSLLRTATTKAPAFDNHEVPNVIPDGSSSEEVLKIIEDVASKLAKKKEEEQAQKSEAGSESTTTSQQEVFPKMELQKQINRSEEASGNSEDEDSEETHGSQSENAEDSKSSQEGTEEDDTHVDTTTEASETSLIKEAAEAEDGEDAQKLDSNEVWPAKDNAVHTAAESMQTAKEAKSVGSGEKSPDEVTEHRAVHSSKETPEEEEKVIQKASGAVKTSGGTEGASEKANGHEKAASGHGGDDDEDPDETEAANPGKSGGKVLITMAEIVGAILMAVAIGAGCYFAYTNQNRPREETAPLAEGAEGPPPPGGGAAPAAAGGAEAPAAADAAEAPPTFSGPATGGEGEAAS